MSATPATPATRRPGFRARGAHWPLIIVGLLVGNAVIAGGLIAAAQSSLPHVVPDYYRKALVHDQVMAQGQRNLAIGWRARVTIGRVAAPVANLQLALSDAGGRPIEGGSAVASAFHRARPDEPAVGRMIEVQPGLYELPLRKVWTGVWQVAIVVEAHGTVFTVDRDVELAAEGG